MTLSFARLGAVGRLMRDFARRKSTCGSSTEGRKRFGLKGTFAAGGVLTNAFSCLQHTTATTFQASRRSGPQDLVAERIGKSQKKCDFRSWRVASGGLFARLALGWQFWRRTGGRFFREQAAEEGESL